MIFLNTLLAAADVIRENRDIHLDLFLIQDLSHSYSVDLPNLQHQIPEIVSYLASEFADARFGMATFVDKPLSTFGYAESKDFCYELNVPLMKVDTILDDDNKSVKGILKKDNGERFDLKELLKNLDTYSGRDRKENQLGALLHAMLSSDTKWQPKTRVPLIVLSTDDKYHEFGDGKIIGLTRTEGIYAKPPLSWCLTEDYPSVNDIKVAVEKLGAKLIFLVTKEVVPEYNKLLHAIGPDNGVVIELTDRSQFISQVIKHGVEHIGLDNDSFGDAATNHRDQLINLERRVVGDLTDDERKVEDVNNKENGKKGVKGFTLKPDLLNMTPLLLCPGKIKFEIMIIQDASASYDDDMSNLNKHIPIVLSDVLDNYPGSKVGFSAFVDKPIEPFGYPESGDYCSIVFEGLTGNTKQIEDRLSKLVIRSGNDPLESQLHALMHMTMSKKIHWSRDNKDDQGNRIIRVAVLVTDAGFHKAGDSNLPPYTGKGTECETNDYPSVEQVARALKKKRILPLFLVTADVEHIYEELLIDMNINGAVELNDDISSSIRKSLVTGLESLCGMEYVSDPDIKSEDADVDAVAALKALLSENDHIKLKIEADESNDKTQK